MTLQEILQKAAAAKKGIQAQISMVQQSVSDLSTGWSSAPPPYNVPGAKVAQNELTPEQVWQQNWQKAYNKAVANNDQKRIQDLLEQKKFHANPDKYHAEQVKAGKAAAWNESFKSMDIMAQVKKYAPWVAGILLIFVAVYGFAKGFGGRPKEAKKD